MSGALPEDQAGLFVLGALNAEEMRAVRLAAARDTALAAEIADWERRLAPLVRLVPEIPPPPSLWPRTTTASRPPRLSLSMTSASFLRFSSLSANIWSCSGPSSTPDSLTPTRRSGRFFDHADLRSGCTRG